MTETLSGDMLKSRVRLLRDGARRKGPVIYWMSRDQRIRDNWALIYAQDLALKSKVDLVVVFCLTVDFLGASLRHYMFLLKGLQEQIPEFAALNIAFHLLEGNPSEQLPIFVQHSSAGILVTDFDPLRIKRQWKEKIADSVQIPFYEVDAHNIVPVWHASSKKEFAAHTLRPKIQALLPDFLTELPPVQKHPYGKAHHEGSLQIDRLAEGIQDKSVAEVGWCIPGERAGLDCLQTFISNRLARYPEDRNNPCLEGQSNLSPYLHFGQIAPQRVALEISRAKVSGETKSVFLEELIVRRELADNFCFYEPCYDQFAGFHPWAQKTLAEHRSDKREYLYSLHQLEQGMTHDDLWNACQMDLAGSGKLHGYLRMYWAKKILEWSASPEEALDSAIYLNDRYSLDGRDPNGYAGIAWSIGGVHDRAWGERKIFGKIRYMSYRGCARKFNVAEYVQRVAGKERDKKRK